MGFIWGKMDNGINAQEGARAVIRKPARTAPMGSTMKKMNVFLVQKPA